MFRKLIAGVARHGRKFLDGILQEGKNGPNPQEVLRADGAPSIRGAPRRLFTQTKYTTSKGYVVQHLAKYARQNLASNFRHQFDKSPIYREYRGLASKLSMYAFVGIGFASCNKDQDFSTVCGQIRVMFAPKMADPLENLEDHDLKCYHLGPMIAKGCNAAVYQAKFKEYEDDSDQSEDESDSGSSVLSSHQEIPEDDSDVEVIEEDLPPATFVVSEQYEQHLLEPEMDYVCLETEDCFSDVEVLSSFGEEDAGEVHFLITCQQKELEAVEQTVDPRDTGKRSPRQDHNSSRDCDLAIKIMFNYDIESNASALFKGLEREMLPARTNNTTELLAQWHNGHRSKEKNRLPPHPNIVDMYGGFVDDFPVLPEAFNVFPDALPERINSEGSGRNKTLFIVMKRYRCTLREYLRANHDLSIYQSTLLLRQLVEAVDHMSGHGVAHRDLKSDNIFVEMVEGCPHLVVSDFGECICRMDDHDLCLPYIIDEISKGGNIALQAPEIASARPGPNSVLDYNNSDLWTVGTLAYEIFGHQNPFYKSNNGTRLNSATYRESELPPLGNHVPEVIQRLIGKMLIRDPKQRPSSRYVSTYLHLLLWSPSEWSLTLTSRTDIDSSSQPTGLDLIHWILISTARVLLENATFDSTDNVEHNLQALFLSHLDFKELMEIVKLLYNE